MNNIKTDELIKCLELINKYIKELETLKTNAEKSDDK